MADPRLFRLRVEFEEKGRLAFLSHLELARALERTVRRAQLPYAVTQGFSPHMRIAFGAALPVGVGGLHEIFDLLMTEYVPEKEALERLQKASVDELMPVSCRYLEHKAAAASVAYPVCTYRAMMSEALDPSDWRVPDTITLVRKKKEKVLRPCDFLVGDMQVDGDQVTFTLESKASGSLRADVLLAKCLEQVNEGREVPVRLCSTMRTAMRERA